MSKSGATIAGRSIVSTIETLSALGSIGNAVLQEHGITTIDPGGRYSFEIRRAIHDAILSRFGEIAIYAFGFNNFWAYPDFIAKQEIYKKDCKGITNVKNVKQAQKSLIKFLTLVTRDIDAGFKSGVKNGSGNYGAELIVQGPDQ